MKRKRLKKEKRMNKAQRVILLGVLGFILPMIIIFGDIVYRLLSN